MRVVFMGSAPISCVSLSALLEDSQCEVVGVVTQPDRASGRNLQVTPGPVRLLAETHGIPVHAPERVNRQASIDVIAGWSPDVIVVLAYGQILKAALLSMARLGCINVHTSLLPKYRGAAPIHWAVVNGETESGVTTMQMDAGMDTGDILLQAVVPIGPDDTAGELHDALAEVGARLLVQTLHERDTGVWVPRAQDHGSATYAPKLSKADGRIKWHETAQDVHNRVRGFNPWPGASCVLPGKGPAEARMLKVHRTRITAGAGEPGTVIDISRGGPTVATMDGAVQLVSVQPAGRKTMSGDDFLRGHSVRMGERLET